MDEEASSSCAMPASPASGEPQASAQSLLMVGVVHLDPQGFGKALHFFERHQPDLILVELSPFGCRFRKKRGKELKRVLQKNLKKAAKSVRISLGRARRQPAISNIYRQLALPFEYRAALRHAGRSGAHVMLVDASHFSQYWIGFWPELIAVTNLQKLLVAPIPSWSPASQYQLARKSLRMPPAFSPSRGPRALSTDDELWAQRECRLADQIRDTLNRRRPQRPVYIGGWQHLTVSASTPTLRQLLHVDPCRCHLLAGEDQSP